MPPLAPSVQARGNRLHRPGLTTLTLNRPTRPQRRPAVAIFPFSGSPRCTPTTARQAGKASSSYWAALAHESSRTTNPRMHGASVNPGTRSLLGNVVRQTSESASGRVFRAWASRKRLLPSAVFLEYAGLPRNCSQRLPWLVAYFPLWKAFLQKYL